MSDFDFQKLIELIYVRDTIEKFVLCENQSNRSITEILGLMQPPKPVLELLTGVPSSRPRTPGSLTPRTRTSGRAGHASCFT